jgi:PPOX class F420-dependent enzyme/OxyR family protein
LSVFTEGETEFLKGHSLGHIATVNGAGEPHIVPLRYLFNPEFETIDLGGHGDPRTKKYYRDLVETGRAAFIVDDVVGPMRVRAVEVRGRVEFLPTGGQNVRPDYDPELVRLWPRHVLAWGIADPDPFNRSSRDVP